MAHNAEQLITAFAKVRMIHGIEYLEYIQEDELNETLNFFVVVFATFYKDSWHYLLLIQNVFIYWGTFIFIYYGNCMLIYYYSIINFRVTWPYYKSNCDWLFHMSFRHSLLCHWEVTR